MTNTHRTEIHSVCMQIWGNTENNTAHTTEAEILARLLFHEFSVYNEIHVTIVKGH